MADETDPLFTHQSYRFNKAMDGDIQEEALRTVGALPEPSIDVDASPRFQ